MNRKLWIAALVAATVSAGCGSRDGGNLAVVNGEPITADEFVQYLKTKERVRIVTDQGQVVEAPVADTLAYQALEDLVSRKLVVQLAKDEGVYPSEQEVLKELDFRKKLNPNFVQVLNTRGQTMQTIKDNLIVELATERLLTKGITVTNEELDKFIVDNKLDKDPATADLLFVYVTQDARKSAFDRDLASGEAFALVATRYSEAQNAKETNARFGIRVINQIPEPIRSKIIATPEGRSTDWIKADSGWVKFYVEKKTPEAPIKVDEAKRELYRREIAKMHGRRGKDLGRRLADKLFESESRIIVNPKDLKEMWAQAMQRAKKERKVALPTANESPSGENK